EAGIKDFEKASEKHGVHFSNALFIDEHGEETAVQYMESEISNIPRGDVYQKLISTYFINPASMMIRRSVFDSIGGYDEQLTYEDFDFWVRSSRTFSYCFNAGVLVKKRVLKNSLSRQQFQFRNPHQRSTYLVCRKIFKLNQSKEEDRELRKRILYEIWQVLKHGNIGLIPRYLLLLAKTRFRSHRRLS
ncbi:MAG: glycosyl transferase, partial [Cyclobacteriaceae bacterium]|nr:glycosyl transferase [Cyclobacteriaceae bacterium HetDA_MAG_MS6]